MQELILACWCGLSMLVGLMHHQKGYSFAMGTVAALFFSPILAGLLVAIERTDQKEMDRRAVASGASTKCPMCFSLIDSRAKICPQCRSKLS